MSKFVPVVLVDKNGQEYTATTAREFNNLASSGYARKNVESNKSADSSVANPVADSEAPIKKPAADEKPARPARASK